MEKRITLLSLGDFCISSGNNIDAGHAFSENCPSKVRQFLTYVLINSNRKISSSEVIDNLWPADTINDPSSSLKSVVFKARNFFQQVGFSEPTKVLLVENGYYYISNDIKLTIDCKEFEKTIEEIKKTTSDKKKVELRKKALSLYKGHFLSNDVSLPWVEVINLHLKTEYLKVCYSVIEDYMNNYCYCEALEVCSRALEIEPYDENLHTYIIKNLVLSGQAGKAVNHYNFVTRIFNDYYGEPPSKSMQLEYKNILDNCFTASYMSDLKAPIKADIEKGAFFCDYQTFLKIYELFARYCFRTNSPVYLIKISAVNYNKNYLEIIKNGLLVSLRSDDVFSLAPDSRYVVLVRNLNLSSCIMIKKRIEKNIINQNNGKIYDLKFEFQPFLS